VLAATGGRGSVHIGYGAVRPAVGGSGARGPGAGNGYPGDNDDDDSDSDTEDELFYAAEGGFELLSWRLRKLWKWFEDTWVSPREKAVRRVTDPWWSRWLVLVVLPAALVRGTANFMTGKRALANRRM